EPVHVFELLVEIEPFGPAVEELAGVGAPHVIVAAALVDSRARIVLALAELVENRPGPPMEMRIDDVHGRPGRPAVANNNHVKVGCVPRQRKERRGTPSSTRHSAATPSCSRRWPPMASISASAAGLAWRSRPRARRSRRSPRWRASRPTWR